MLKYISLGSLGLFIVFSLCHLYYSWIDNKQGRAVTKPFLLIFLILYYVFATENISYFLLFALITSWLGDILLIPKGHVWFSAGGISFGASHILFILVYSSQILYASVSRIPVIIAAISYAAIVFAVMKKIWSDTPKLMRGTMALYLLANGTMNVFALMQLLSNASAGSWIAYIGAILFFISDNTLFLVRYYKKKQIIFKKHFTVMLTYLLGEFMITQGMIMLGK